MAKTMKLISALSVTAAIIFSVIYKFSSISIFLTLAITFGTTAYHFCIRLIIGSLINLIMKNKADYTKKWYNVGEREQKLYKKLKVKKWKNNMPTYNASLFDISLHSWDEIAQASCQAELVHETNVVISFVPIILTLWFGPAAVFIITSVIAAAYDMLFVIMQRFNRPRILKMVNRSEKTILH